MSNDWLDKPEPSPTDGGNSAAVFNNVSLRKYLPWIKIWGGWELFQELLHVLSDIANKHSVSISNVAVRWVLDQPQVGGTIVGARLGYRDHIQETIKVFSFKLDDDDLQQIKAIQEKSKKTGRTLYKVFGDCGGEYRRG